MAENENVSKDICKIIHKEVDRRLNGLDDCIKDIRDAVNEMKEVSAASREIAASNKEILNFLMAQQSKDKNILGKNETFWDTKSGQLIPWLGFAVIVIIIAALVGTNLIEGWQQVKDVIPK